MLRRIWRRTEIGRKQDVFSFCSHKMLLGTFGLDPAGNVICLFQHRANITAGSWGIVVHGSVSWPLHWWAMQRRHRLRIEDIRNDPRLCSSVFWRRFYKSVRGVYLVMLAYVWFLMYILAKQNALNQDARIVLTELEIEGIKYLDKKVVVGIFGDPADDDQNITSSSSGDAENITDSLATTGVNMTNRIRGMGKAIREISFALAEDFGCFDVDQDLDDRYEMNMRRKEHLLAMKKKKSASNKKKNDESAVKSEHAWKIALGLIGVVAFVIGA